MARKRRKQIRLTVTFPVDMTAKQARTHIAAACNWWTVKVIPEAKIHFIVKGK